VRVNAIEAADQRLQKLYTRPNANNIRRRKHARAWTGEVEPERDRACAALFHRRSSVTGQMIAAGGAKDLNVADA